MDELADALDEAKDTLGLLPKGLWDELGAFKNYVNTLVAFGKAASEVRFRGFLPLSQRI